MAFFSVQTTNPNFSYCIGKKPTDKPQIKSLHNGYVFGLYSNDYNTYNVYFEDAKDEISYKTKENEEFEYLNDSRYNSPRFVLDSLKMFFRSAYKNCIQEDAVGYKHTIFINLLSVKQSTYLSVFQNYFPNYLIEHEEVTKNNFRVTISSDTVTLYEMLNFVSLFCIVVSVSNKENVFISDEMIQKYLNAMLVTNAPYFIRYIFKSRVIKTKAQFDNFKNLLELSKDDVIEMEFGDSHIMRMNFIKEKLEYDNNIIDIGCGEGRYISIFNNTLKKNNKTYYACDTNEEILNNTKHKFVDVKKNDNIEFFDSVKSMFEKTSTLNEKSNVILSEVIEHMEVDEAKALIIEVLNQNNLNQILITTTNKDFNKNFSGRSDENPYRNDDHKFEFTKNEFFIFMDKIINSDYKDKYTTEFYGVGDSVNGDEITSCVLIKAI